MAMLQETTEQLSFEKLLADSTTQLVQSGAEQLDSTINLTLKNFSKFFKVQTAFLATFTKEGKQSHHRKVWADDTIEVQYFPAKFDLSEVSPWFVQQIISGKVINTGPGLVDLPDESGNLREVLQQENINSGLAVPVHLDDGSIILIGFDSLDHPIEFPPQLINRLKVLGIAIGSSLQRAEYQSSLKRSLKEVEQLKEQLEEENVYLRSELNIEPASRKIVGNSKPLIKMLQTVTQVAETQSTVLILGETGTGKELIANEIHRLGHRKERPMIKVNCAALPATLIESELFGREKGAFTGSMSRQIGRFEIADGATLFLDEIGELPLELQAKLLRVLQDGTFERLGSTETIKADVRIIASTNRDLKRAIREGRFREDLYYRLNVFPIDVPPLRDRLEDVPMLTWSFVKEFEKSMGKTIHTISQKSFDRLQLYSWPGNVRELKNHIERAMIVAKGRTLQIELSQDTAAFIPQNQTLELEDVQRNHILKVLEKTGWRISGKNGAAELLGLKPTTLKSKMKKLEITRPNNTT